MVKEPSSSPPRRERLKVRSGAGPPPPHHGTPQTCVVEFKGGIFASAVLLQNSRGRSSNQHATYCERFALDVFNEDKILFGMVFLEI